MRRRHAVVAIFAASAVLGGLAVGLGSRPRPETEAPGIFGVLVAGFALLALVLKLLLSSGDGPGTEPAPWTEEGAVVDRAPERTPDDVDVSGTALAARVERATRAARSAGDVEAGVEHVRPPLRTALGRALVAGGHDPGAVEETMAEGTWTDDALAAAVLDEAVEPPGRSFRERLRDWLFPERGVRERTGRAVAAVDEAASAALPAVVGEDAPRTVPVVAPALEDLQRTADGRLQRAEAVGDGGWRQRRPGALSRADAEQSSPGNDHSEAKTPAQAGEREPARSNGRESAPSNEQEPARTNGKGPDGMNGGDPARSTGQEPGEGATDRSTTVDGDWDDVAGGGS